jgi:hypothetical protein
VSWNIEASQLFWKGAAILFLADTLSNAGYSVEVITSIQMKNVELKGAASSITKAVTLKAASDPLNLNNLASGLCLAGFFRVLGFAHAAQCPFPIDSGWGKPSSITAGDIDAPDTSIVVQGSEVKDLVSAQAYIERTLAGIESGEIAL